MRRFSLVVVALFACALSALGDYASATSSATITAVSTLPPAGEVVELTVRWMRRKKKRETSFHSIDGHRSEDDFFLNLLLE